MATIPSRPYPWPWHGEFEPARTALLITWDGGALDARPLDSVRRLADAARAAGATVFFLPASGEAGPLALAEIADLVIERPVMGGLTATPLDFELRSRSIRDLAFAGFPFELGADCTMREANDAGYECLLVEDASTGLSPQTFRGAVSSCQMSGGIFGAVGRAADLFDLFGRSSAQAIGA